ncbi:hypothetical protein [Hydrogenophaga sp.]|uniref:hypothetical protein n=1 Tax=Hydrogenophaga sp. TaxID=1904254 RepID=UPI0035642BB4
MNIFNTKPVLLAGALSALLLAGCGGGSSVAGPGVPNPVAPDVTLSVDQMLAFIQNLINNVDGNGDPVDVNKITLTTDDTASPAGI